MSRVQPETLNDICELIVDCEHKTAPIADHETGYLSIRTPNVGRGRLILDGVNHVTYETYIEWSQRAIPRPGDLILAREAPVGNVAIVPYNRKVCLGQRTVLIRPDRDKVDPAYLVYLLNGDEVQGKLQAYASGATVPHLNMSDIRSLELPTLPLRETQRKIAAVLSAYDDLIENNTQRIAALEAAAQALYREWFVEFRFPGHESVEWVESELGRIPRGWKWVTLADLVESPRDSVQPDEVDPVTPYVGLAHIPQKSIALYQWGEAGETVSTKLVFKKGDILFAKIRPYLHKVAVAPLNGVCSSDTIIIRPSHPEIYGLVLQTVFSDEFVGHADTTSQGTNMPRANWDVLVQYPIPLPPNGLLGHFNSLVQDSIELIGNMIFRNRTLRNARDLLLPRLISGELSVEQVPLPDDLDLTGR